MLASVDICVATVRRPGLLSDALESLARQKIPEGVEVRIVVVDNDAQGGAKDAVAAFAKRAPVPVVYVHEPTKGIASARNAALSQRRGDYVAFFDDDQVADPNWLANLYRTAREYSADVVFGPVLSRLPPQTPAWLIRGGFFDRIRSRTGARRPYGGTGSALIRASVIDRDGSGFDAAYGLTGGSDTEYFARLGAQGAVMVWCDEALAWEDVPPARATLRWLLRRNFRGGLVYARIFVPRLSASGKVGWFAKRMVGIAAGSLGCVVAAPFSRRRAARAMLLASRNLGQLSHAFAASFDEYSQQHRA